MKKLAYVLGLLTIPTLLILSAGCGGTPSKKEESKTTTKPKGTEEAKTPVKSDGWTVLKGKFVYEGEPPEPINKIEQKPDEQECHKDTATKEEMSQQVWMVNPKNKGVANVVVFLKAPDGQFFKISDEQLKEAKSKKVVLDQPHCAYIPHIVTLFPEYYDASKKDMDKTGQVFAVKNSAVKIVHDTTVVADTTKKYQLPPKTEKSVNTPEDDPLSPRPQPYDITCNYHKFMRGYAWSFDHPYAAVSKGFPVMAGDNAKKVAADDWGTFEVKVPAKAKVNVVVWHEGINFLNSQGFEGENGKEVTTSGEATHDLGTIKIKAKSK
jgi:hypothetical protein